MNNELEYKKCYEEIQKLSQRIKKEINRCRTKKELMKVCTWYYPDGVSADLPFWSYLSMHALWESVWPWISFDPQSIPLSFNNLLWLYGDSQITKLQVERYIEFFYAEKRKEIRKNKKAKEEWKDINFGWNESDILISDRNDLKI